MMKILVVDDEKTITDTMALFLREENYRVNVAQSAPEAFELLSKESFDVLLLDIWMPGDYDGMGLMEKLEALTQAPAVIMMSGHGSIDIAVQATKMGAWDFLEKPLSMDHVLIQLKNISQKNRLKSQRDAWKKLYLEELEIVGSSESTQFLKKAVVRNARTSQGLYIWGQKGLGKSLVAKSIHENSKREGLFVEFNAEQVSSREAISIIKGFSDGDLSEYSLIKKAQAGSFYIKNIDFLNIKTQEFLVQLLDKSVAEVNPPRFILSGMQPVEKLREQGFLGEFLDKFCIHKIAMPSWEERSSDLEALVKFFSLKAVEKWGGKLLVLGPDDIKEISQKKWKSSFAELRSYIEYKHLSA